MAPEVLGISVEVGSADLRAAGLNDANLENAVLVDAKEHSERGLELQAKSLEGATMPDGSIHD